MENQTVGTDRSEKHIEIDDAIENINSVIGHLDQLLHHINPRPLPAVGEDTTAKTAERRPYIEVLNSASSRIRDKVERLHSQISEIEEMLF